MVLRFIDSNVFLRHFLADDVRKAAAARQLLLRVEAGTERVTTSPLVLFELVFILHRSYKVPKDKVASLVGGVLDYRGLHLALPHLLEACWIIVGYILPRRTSGEIPLHSGLTTQLTSQMPIMSHPCAARVSRKYMRSIGTISTLRTFCGLSRMSRLLMKLHRK
jgi:hypothetical protein